MSQPHIQPVIPYAVPTKGPSRVWVIPLIALPLLFTAIAVWWWLSRDWGLYLTKAGKTSRAGDLPLWWQIIASACAGIIATTAIVGLVLVAIAFARATVEGPPPRS